MLLPYSEKKAGLKKAILMSLVFIVFLWLIKFTEQILQTSFVSLGIYPREWHGLIGIIFAPLIHGSVSHLFANTLPLLILGSFCIYGFPKAMRYALPLIYFGSGIGVWFFARQSYHIGASGITHGLMFFIFTIGILRRDRLSIVLAMLVFFLYGSMIWSIFPIKESISFESHLSGAVTGILAAILLRKRDPAPVEKKYAWEREEDEDDPVIGEQWRINADKEK